MSERPSPSVPSVMTTWVAGALLLLFVVLTSLVCFSHREPLPWDQLWRDTLVGHTPEALISAARFLNRAGGTAIMVIITAVISLTLWLRSQAWSRAAARPQRSSRRTPSAWLELPAWRAPAAITASVLAAALCSEAVKLMVQRPRPMDAMVFARGDSFPSGHTTAAAACAIALALILRRTWCWVLACAWVTAMALSRTLLSVHWASDTIAGAALGSAVAIIAVQVLCHPKPQAPAKLIR